MGRKLRFFVTKNQERKKALAARTLSLPVSIPLSLGVAVHQLSVEVDVEKPSELTVMLPIAAYANAPCQDLAHLQSRLLPFHYAGCEVFLSQRICQDALEKFFGCQRQRGRTHDNPNALEFLRNTQALRVVNTASRVVKGNCRGTMKEKEEADQENQPLPKRWRKRK